MPYSFDDNKAFCVARIMPAENRPYQQNSQSDRHRLKTIKQVNKYGNNYSLLCCEVAHCSIISSEKLNNLFGLMNVKRMLLVGEAGVNYAA